MSTVLRARAIKGRPQVQGHVTHTSHENSKHYIKDNYHAHISEVTYALQGNHTQGDPHSINIHTPGITNAKRHRYHYSLSI